MGVVGEYEIKLDNFKIANPSLFGRLEDSIDGKERKLYIQFDIESNIDNQRFELLKGIIYMTKFTKASTVNVYMVSGEKILVTELDCRFAWVEKTSVVFEIHKEVVSCNTVEEVPLLENKIYTKILFELESNRNIREVLRENYSSDTTLGKYKESGNQYKRSISLEISSGWTFSECENFIRNLVFLRTFIDGFQNSEANIVLVSDGKNIDYNYISRRKTDKYRWYSQARFEKIDFSAYIKLLIYFHTQDRNSVMKNTINVCEYLHTPNFSLPTSRFIEMITAFEGFAKYDATINNFPVIVDKKWELLAEQIEQDIISSGYEGAAIKRMKQRVKIINPANEKITQWLQYLFKMTLLYLELSIDSTKYSDLILNIVQVRNNLSHNPAEYHDGALLKDNQIVYATCLLREMLIINILTDSLKNVENVGLLKISNSPSKYISRLFDNLLIPEPGISV